MMNSRRIFWSVLLGLPGVVIAALLGLILASWRRPTLGLADGRLRPCPDSPNCVCSLDTDARHGIKPFPADDDTMDQLRNVLHALPGITIIHDDGNYLRAECSTPILRFVDDLEFLYDADQHVIHVRSASRVGHSDRGENRKRVERIRPRLAESARP